MKVLASRMKIKTLIRRVVGCGVIRALSKAKSIVVEILKRHQKSIDYRKKKMFFGSFRMHYNWCSSSHVMPVPAPLMISTADEFESSPPSQLSGYLRWLEDKGNTTDNEIDKLADMFIADSHQKFMLEKVESNRRFQDMLARSV